MAEFRDRDEASKKKKIRMQENVKTRKLRI